LRGEQHEDVTVDRLDPLDRALATNAVGTAEQIAAKYAKVFPQNADDIESSAYWGAVKAATEYDAARSENVTWRNWSKFRISNEIRDFLRSSWVQRATMLGLDFEEIGDPTTGKVVEDVDDKDECAYLRGLLTPAQQRLLDAVRGNGGSVEDAAHVLGVTYDYARKCYSRSVERLRTACTS
jgi:DNA-directed RNA polymerase specialized sigma24 family protein